MSIGPGTRRGPRTPSTRPPWPGAARRRGRSVLVVAGSVAAFALLALAIHLVTRGGPHARVPSPTSTDSTGAARATEDVETTGAEHRSSLAAEGPIEIGADLPWKQAPKSFDGACTISGTVEVIGGLPFPDRWTLVIEPSSFAIGREHAERREVRMDGAQRTFEERDLPMGGYRVYAAADGMNCRAQEVLLFRVAGDAQGSTKDHARLILHLTRAGNIDGAVTDDAGGTPSGLPVILELLDDGTRQIVETSPAGIWRFDGVRDGRYRLSFGSAERPLIPAEELAFVGPSQRFPDRVVPVTVKLEILVLDERGLPLAEASVRGFGQPSGVIDTMTDEDGIACVPFAVPGRYNVRVNHAPGRRGRSLFELQGGEPTRTVEVRCLPED